ncbi:hypothetical protein P154DRAFT_263586 [Amniculicola lignicola CBS 123094]|uniref:Uncharacterized protein n=1 Tax=Amniculicola lignicola CBS 123094 TaxID=1392246 RepID=A0A6A5WAK0_9PLEO|nr:hypothetical protein P154DRAFT_263586 [Amniculicola lignicola CBS 123094]
MQVSHQAGCMSIQPHWRANRRGSVETSPHPLKAVPHAVGRHFIKVEIMQLLINLSFYISVGFRYLMLKDAFPQ